MSEDLSAPEANRRFYEELAASYDETEHCIATGREQDVLRTALESALRLTGPRPRALDACGGSGNAARMLAELGGAPLVVDISPEMVARWREKAKAAGVEPGAEVAEIEEFLRTDERVWDLIVFSSALHHLEDYEAVLSLAGARLAPGGAILTIFDPTIGGFLVRILRRLDWIIWTARHAPSRVPQLIVGRLRRIAGSGDPELSIGRLAERHAIKGIDDEALVESLRDAGFEIVSHAREYDARHAVVRTALRLIRRPSAFSLLLRKAPGT